jgi:hypothetical protein
MKKKVYIILIGFNSIQEGIEYNQNSPYKISFSVDGVTYNEDGDTIETPNNSEVIPNGGIYVCNNQNPISGQLYIEDGFLKYFKYVAENE